MIDVRRLHVLRAVDHFGGVAKAGTALHLTPSAVSHQIRQLAAEVGAPLLEQRGRGVRLTGAAHTLLRFAHEVERRWEQTRAELTPAAGRSHVTLCGIATAVAMLLAPAARALSRQENGPTVRLQEAEPAEAFDQLLAEAADVAVVHPTPRTPPRADPRFEQTPLLRDPYDLLLPADHALAGRAEVALTEVADDDWVVETAESSSWHDTLQACAVAGFTPRLAHEARHWDGIATLVDQQLGIALVPRLATLSATTAARRVQVAPGNAPARTLIIAVRRGSATQPGIAQAVDQIRGAATRHGEAPSRVTGREMVTSRSPTMAIEST